MRLRPSAGQAQPKILEGQQNQRAQHFFLFGLCLHETYNTNIDRWSCCPSFLTAKIKSSHEREIIIKSDRKKHKQKILTQVGLQIFSQNLYFFFFLANWQRKTRQLDGLYMLKGQLISKCPYEKSVLSKIPTKKFLRFLSQPLNQKNKGTLLY